MKTLLLVTMTLGLFFTWPSTSFVYPDSEIISIPDEAGIEVGDKAPQFNLKNIDGKMYSFDNIKDAKGNKPKGFIIVFTCNTCPFAQAT